ncbi:MAG: hypothetical protein K8R21_00470 [Leptospira sp.]|nr:hypothetical protein [Leptospira sp.]
MLDKIRQYTFPHLIGLLLMIAGWLISVINVGLDKFGSSAIITQYTIGGLITIIIGAYFPEIWIGISNKFSKK